MRQTTQAPIAACARRVGHGTSSCAGLDAPGPGLVSPQETIRMRRREFLGKGLLWTGGLALAKTAGGMKVMKTGNRQTRKPNLVFFFSDQHRHASMPGRPHCNVAAPHMRRLAREGLTFTHCISNYPVCTPYRGMLISGRWPYRTGVIDNAMELAPASSIGMCFKKAGYTTAYIGKWHLFDYRSGRRHEPPGPGRHGFDDLWQIWYNTNHHFDVSFTYDHATGKKVIPKGYNARGMTDQALRFLDGQKDREKPFCLFVSLNPPHPDFYDAPQAYREMYPEDAILAPPNVRHKVDANVLGRHKGPRHLLAGYYAHISAVDRELGRIMEKLHEIRKADKTILVYTSDHGEMAFSHGRIGKRVPWDESIRVPFLIRWPGKIAAGVSTDTIFGAIDIYPTLLGLCGIAVPETADGKNFASCILGNHAGDQDAAFLMHLDKQRASGGVRHPAELFRGVRTGQYTYAFNMQTNEPWLLYDNDADPWQQTNLIHDGGYRKLRHDMHGLTMEWMKRSGDLHVLPGN